MEAGARRGEADLKPPKARGDGGARPLQPARRLLGRVVGEARREEAEADLEELFARSAERDGRMFAWVRYWRELIALAGWRVFEGARALSFPTAWRTKGMLRDVRYAVRGLARDRAFSLTAVLVVGVGIGLNAAMYGVVRDVVLRPLPFPEPERVAWIMGAWPEQGWAMASASIPELQDLARRTDALSQVGIYRDGVSVPLTGDGRVEPLNVTFADSSYFRVLGAAPLAGRLFERPEDVDPGAHPVVLISEALWRTRLGASRNAVGTRLELAGEPYTVVGVLPRDFWDLGSSAQPVDAWLPLTMGGPWLGHSMFETRGHRQYAGVARLPEGVSWERAQAEADALALDLEQEFPDAHRGRRLRLHPLREAFYGSVEAPVRVLSGGAAVLLLVCLIDVAALLMLRATLRRRELALRLALGAPRGRLVRLQLAESLLIAVLGGAVGVVLADLGLRAVLATFPLPLPAHATVGVDAGVVFATALAVVGVGILCGLYPALRASRQDPSAALDGSRGAAPRDLDSRVWRLVVASQVAAAVVLLVGAGLAVRSLQRLVATDLGFVTEGVLTARIEMRGEGPLPEDEAERRRVEAERRAALARFAEQLSERAGALPGVIAAGLWGPSLPGDANWHLPVTPEGGDPSDPAQVALAQRLVATLGALEALGIRVLRGRSLDQRDRPEAPPVALVDERLAARYWPGENPVGRRLYVEGDAVRRVTVVGLVADALHRGRRTSADVVPGDVYLPYAQQPWRSTTIVVRTGTAPRSVVGPLAGVLLELAPHVALTDVATMSERLRDSEATPRFAALLLGVYAGIAALLALVGTWGTLAFVVANRSREIAVRMAIGARRGSIAAQVLRQGMQPVAVGLGLGLASAAALSGMLDSLLFGIGRLDFPTYAGVALVLSVAAATACLAPAARAARLDPMRVIRDE